MQPGSKGLRARSEGLRRWEGKLWRSFQPRLCDGGWTDARKGRQAGRQASRQTKGGSLAEVVVFYWTSGAWILRGMVQSPLEVLLLTRELWWRVYYPTWLRMLSFEG